MEPRRFCSRLGYPPAPESPPNLDTGSALRRPLSALPWILAIAVGMGTVAARAQEIQPLAGNTVTVQYGAFNVGRDPIHGSAGVELRAAARSFGLPHYDRLRLFPVAGFGTSTRHALFGYAGTRADLALPHRWRMSAGFAFTLYSHQQDMDLGGPIVFRSSFVLAYQLRGGVEVGATFFHMSNARLYRNNPGTNVLAVLIEVPLHREPSPSGWRARPGNH